MSLNAVAQIWLPISGNGNLLAFRLRKSWRGGFHVRGHDHQRFAERERRRDRGRGGFAGGRVWGSTAGVWSSRDGAERRHLLGTVVAHSELSDDLMLGGMLQLGLSENSTTLRMAS